jgi:hypothetical protein
MAWAADPCQGDVMTQALQLQRLVYELLDAHDDTARLVAEGAGAQCWESHLEYLRRLQRVSREVLARALAEAPAHR